MADLIKGILAKASSFDATKRIVRPNGEVRYIRCVGAPVGENQSPLASPLFEHIYTNAYQRAERTRRERNKANATRRKREGKVIADGSLTRSTGNRSARRNNGRIQLIARFFHIVISSQ